MNISFEVTRPLCSAMPNLEEKYEITFFRKNVQLKKVLVGIHIFPFSLKNALPHVLKRNKSAKERHIRNSWTNFGPGEKSVYASKIFKNCNAAIWEKELMYNRIGF